MATDGVNAHCAKIFSTRKLAAFDKMKLTWKINGQLQKLEQIKRKRHFIRSMLSSGPHPNAGIKLFRLEFRSFFIYTKDYIIGVHIKLVYSDIIQAAKGNPFTDYPFQSVPTKLKLHPGNTYLQV